MGFDLKPNRKSNGPFHMGAFSWHWMLDAGVGLPLGYGQGIKPAQFVFRERKDGLCVGYNDGARVSAKEARQMAQLANWVADYQDIKRSVFERMPENERSEVEKDHLRVYSQPVREDFVKLARSFAEWAVKSGGFRVF